MQTIRRMIGVALIALVSLAPATSVTAQQNALLWQALRDGGHVALMRHALAPGTGDPANFQLDDCSTQRNLSDGGREQARQIGERFRANGIDQLPVYSSQWCRCLETAELLGLGEVQPLPSLNSFFQNRARGPEQTAATLDWLRERQNGPSLVLVTHQVNVTALSSVFPQSGEIVVARITNEGLEVLGRITPP